MGKKTEGNVNKDGTGQKRGQEVVSLDPQALGFLFGPNYFVGNHPADKLTLSAKCRKRHDP
jgi:hypothetical protein